MLVLLFSLSSISSAQTGFSSDGREYLLGMLYPSLNNYSFAKFFTATALVTSQVDNTNNLHITFKNGLIEVTNFGEIPPSQCALFDMLGRKIKNWDTSDFEHRQNAVALSCPELPSGMYVLVIHSNVDQYVKFMVNR